MHLKKKPKNKVIKIRCVEETFYRFREIASKFRDYEEALNVLMDSYKEMKRIRGKIF